MDSKSTKESTLNGPHVHLLSVNDYRSLYVSQRLVVNMLFNMLIIFFKKNTNSAFEITHKYFFP